MCSAEPQATSTVCCISSSVSVGNAQHDETVGENPVFHSHLHALEETRNVQPLARVLLHPRRSGFQGETGETGPRRPQRLHVAFRKDIGANGVGKHDLDTNVPLGDEFTKTLQPFPIQVEDVVHELNVVNAIGANMLLDLIDDTLRRMRPKLLAENLMTSTALVGAAAAAEQRHVPAARNGRYG